MRGHHDLEVPGRRSRVVSVAGRRRGSGLSGVVCSLAKVSQQKGLQLGVQVRFGFFDQQHGQVGVLQGTQLGQDGCDVQGVGVAESGRAQRAEDPCGVTKHHLEGPRDRGQARVDDLKARLLRVRASGELLEGLVDLVLQPADDSDVDDPV